MKHDRSSSRWMCCKSNWNKYTTNSDIPMITWLTICCPSLPLITIYYHPLPFITLYYFPFPSITFHYLPFPFIPLHSLAFPSVPFCYLSQHSNQPKFSSKAIQATFVALFNHNCLRILSRTYSTHIWWDRSRMLSFGPRRQIINPADANIMHW